MEKFYLGMDIGTQSVGMACTDEQYNLLRAKGKDLWAVRLFDEAKDASERRTKRVARRRLQRRAARIDTLQMLFAPFMEDELFFLRLNNSPYICEDKAEGLCLKYSLFADKHYTDKDFHRSYPTIFHLRKALIEGKEKYDLRLYYLALHHIVKYRGHFLFEGENVGDVLDIGRLLKEFNDIAENLFEENAPVLDVEKGEVFFAVATAPKGLKDRLKECCEVFKVQTKQSNEILKFLLGGKVKPRVLFADESALKEEKSFSLNEITDEELEAKKEVFGDFYALIEKAKEIFDFIRFKKILGGDEYISEAMVRIYERHGKDLRMLKALLKEDVELYNEVFKSTDKQFNYVNYVGYTKPQRHKIPVKKCKSEEFSKWLKKRLTENAAALSSKPDFETVMKKLDAGEFLPKILYADNGVFPHQVNGAELEAILKNLERDYPEFSQKDGEGYSVADKIIALFRFKIPYYVGPLNTAHAQKKDGNGGNSWLVRKKEGKITPWNFEETVDKAASNEAFMRRMTNKCSYLHCKDVLPKDSVIYQKFDVLNQLNKMQINGEAISVGLKQRIFNELFLKYRKVTDRLLKKYLADIGYATPFEEISVTGKDGDFKCSMSSYISLKNILGEKADSMPGLCEDAVLWHSLNTDKKIVENLLRNRYGTVLSESEIKALKALSFKDFGRLSKEFLCDLQGGTDPVTGEIYTILGELYNTNRNLNEILFDERYDFRAAIDAENGGGIGEITYESVQELYVSPQVRRGVWQALVMADEYINAVGRMPDKIFIEVTRENEADPVRKGSRKNQLLALYKTAKDVDDLMSELNRKTDSDLRSERLYLYFRQFGRCAYSGERIDLDSLSGDTYDVDHILPRTFIKDDSLDNKVLVLRTKNALKSDMYPLPESCRQKQLWDIWKSQGCISAKKYGLLTRVNSLTQEDFEGFIQKQIVVTGQTVKAVAELLNRKYAPLGTKIVYSKAKNVSGFKDKYKIEKCRETNDLHHARDAYLNIVVGNVYDTRFSTLEAYYYQKDDGWREYNLKKLFEQNTSGAWDKETSLKKVLETVSRTSMTVTRYALINKGGFYDETVYGKDDKGVTVPRKNNSPLADTTKYGGYKVLRTAYFSVVRSLDKKGKPMKTIEAIPVLVDYRIKGDKQGLLAYFEKQGLIKPEILVEKVKMKSLVSVNGFLCRLAGITGDQILVHNAVQWFTSASTDKYVKKLVQLRDWERTGRLSAEEKENKEFIMDTNRFSERKMVINGEKNLALFDRILENLSKKIYSGISGAANFRDTLGRRRADFEKLTVLEQAKVLLECIRFLKCNAETSNLEAVGEGKQSGKLSINKNISNIKFVLVHQSPCGLTERRREV